MYQFVLRFARKLGMVPGKEGIMQISNKQAVIDISNDILTKFKNHKVPNEAIQSENDVKVIYNQIKNMEEQTLAKNLKTALTPKKSGDVLDLTGKKIDTSKPISGGKNVPETEEQILERLNRQNKESIERLKNKKLTDPEDLAHGGRTGTGLNYLLGEDDQNSRVPYGGGGVGKPPTTFTLTGGGGYGKNQNIMDQGKSIPGLNQEHYGYGFDLGTEIDLPWGLSLQGGAGIGRGSTKTDYKGQPVDWLSGVGETKLGDKWNVGLEKKWTFADGGRIGLKDGTKFDPKRRTILKGIATLAALPVIGKYFKWAKPLAKSSKVLTSVPIKDISGMPAWFKPLVNKVIKEGEEIGSSVERQIVHRVELPGSKTKVYVTQDLNTGDVLVDIGAGKHGFAEGHLGQPVRLEYKASEVIEPTITKGKPTKATKTKEEFWVEEAEFSGGHPENVKFEDSTFEKFGQHGSDFSEVEKFATGTVKKKTGKATIKPRKVDWVDEDFASGGRVPMWMGGGLSKGKELLRNMVKYFAKESTIGKKPSEYLKISNPKQYKKMLNDLSIYNKYHPGEGIMAPQMIKDMIKKTEGERAGVIEHIIGAARNIKKADKSVAVYKKQMVDAMVEKGADKKTAEFISDGMSKAIDVKDTPKITEEALLELETIYKNMLMKEGRQLNATGGRVSLSAGGLAGMLGE